VNQCMYRYRFQATFKARPQQSGATLIIVLVLLILITLFGMASVRGTLLQERMVSGTISNNLAFQAAEAGLRYAENIVAKTEPAIPSSGCSAGLCARWDPASPNPPPFAQAGFWDGTGPALSPISLNEGPFRVIPKYIIEDFGKGESGISTATDKAVALPQPPPPPPNLYRITAYAKAPGTDAETIVQSIYVR